jgi:hypothetical protein
MDCCRSAVPSLDSLRVPLGKVILILYQAEPEVRPEGNVYSIYWGRVLVPDGKPQSYRIEALPALTDGYGRLDHEIKSIFAAAADTDGDAAPEICILAEVNEIGIGKLGNPYFDTDIFKWTGTKFTLVEQGDKRPLYGLRNAKAVRARIKKMRVKGASKGSR